MQVRSMIVGIWVGCMLSNMAWANLASDGLAERVVETRPREGVTMRSLLSRRVSGGERWLVVSFPGYPGILRLQENEGGITYELKGNFLIRARRHLVSSDIAVATLDCPSDEFAACGDRYRDSERHMNDVIQQIEALKAQMGADIKVAIIGTSYGTVSSQLLAKKLDGRIDAAIHTASITSPASGSGLPLYGLDLTAIKTRQLIVHHLDDPCKFTMFDPLRKYQGKIPMLLVKGVGTPRGNACDAFTQHGFVGREQAVMLGIARWLLVDELISPID